MTKNNINKLISKFGGSEIIRIYDVCSIICLSIFANLVVSLFQNQSQLNDLKTVVLLLFFLFEGVGLTSLYSLYTKCHHRTSDYVHEGKSNFLPPNYDHLFLDSVESKAHYFKFYWTIVILPYFVLIILWVFNYIFILKEWILKLLSTSCN